MALEGTYEYECMRAELLGVDKPDYEEFLRNKAAKEAAELEALEAESMKEQQAQKEGFQLVGGKLDELNNILKSTQKKINNFAAPFSNFLRSKIGSSKAADAGTTSGPEIDSTTGDNLYPVDLGSYPDENGREPVQKKHVPAIDDLIDKFDNAHTNMEFQNKQMKRFLK